MRKVVIIGLGYVGLPLAVHLSRKNKVIGFDTDVTKIQELQNNIDRNLQFNFDELSKVNIKYTHSVDDIKIGDFYIITVPSPIDHHNNPDISYLQSATKTVASVLNKDDIVVYESTVYPSFTEEECLPILLKYSGLKRNDFGLGYSPERVNPGDIEHNIDNIVKIVSADNEKNLDIIDKVYSSITTTYRAESIQIAEAAKITENIQRDVNIALMNHLSLMYSKMNLDTLSILKASATKWNFAHYTPGLVGGHCVSVDPYYLIYKAKQIGFDLSFLKNARVINEDMAIHISQESINALSDKYNTINNNTVNIFGLSFKSNVNDIRNSKSFLVIEEFKKHNFIVSCHDPIVEFTSVESENIRVINQDIHDIKPADILMLIVAHKKFIDMASNGQIFQYVQENGIIYDLFGLISKENIANNKNITIIRP